MSCTREHQEKSGKKLLIINVDPGIDDAQAILMALADPSVKILALCVHHGNSSIDNTTTNTLKLLTEVNRTDVPVFRGCEHALVTQPAHGDDYFGKDGFGDYEGLPQPNLDLVQPEHAVLAMIRLVNEYPGEITLVGLGPLTNLAMAHRLDPDFSKKLKDCFIMGGNYKGKGNITASAEFNFHFDVEAAQVVLSEFVCQIYIFTWELCIDSAMPWEVYYNLRAMPTTNSKLMKNLELKLLDRWKKSKVRYTICDELAMAAVLCQQCMVEWQDVSAEVECHGQLTRGQVVVDWRNRKNKRQNIRLVTKMDMELVQKLLMRVYSESG